MAVDLGLDTKLSSLEANKGKEAEFMEDMVDLLNSAAHSDETPFGSASKARLATQEEVNSRTGSGLVQAKLLGSFGELNYTYVGELYPRSEIPSHISLIENAFNITLPENVEWFALSTERSSDFVSSFVFVNGPELYSARSNTGIGFYRNFYFEENYNFWLYTNSSRQLCLRRPANSVAVGLANRLLWSLS